jgi:hypothetical protein
MQSTNSSWIQLYSQYDQWEIVYGNQLHDTISKLNNPTIQKPSLIGFIGGKTKAKIIRSLFPNSNYRVRSQKGLLGLYYDKNTL